MKLMIGFSIVCAMILAGNFASAESESHLEINGIVREITPSMIAVHDEQKGAVIHFKIDKNVTIPKDIKNGDSVRIKYSLNANQIELQLPGTVGPASIHPTSTPKHIPDSELDDRAFYRA